MFSLVPVSYFFDFAVARDIKSFLRPMIGHGFPMFKFRFSINNPTTDTM
jgi:hypothetical protein